MTVNKTSSPTRLSSRDFIWRDSELAEPETIPFAAQEAQVAIALVRGNSDPALANHIRKVTAPRLADSRKGGGNLTVWGISYVHVSHCDSRQQVGGRGGE